MKEVYPTRHRALSVRSSLSLELNTVRTWRLLWLHVRFFDILLTLLKGIEDWNQMRHEVNYFVWFQIFYGGNNNNVPTYQHAPRFLVVFAICIQRGQSSGVPRRETVWHLRHQVPPSVNPMQFRLERVPVHGWIQVFHTTSNH